MEQDDFSAKAKSFSLELEPTETTWEMPKPNISHLVVDCSTIAYLDDLGVQGLQQVRVTSFTFSHLE